MTEAGLEVAFGHGHTLKIVPCPRRRELAFVLVTPREEYSRQMTMADLAALVPDDEPAPIRRSPQHEPRAPRPDRNTTDGGLQLLARRNLLEWTLPNGMALGDARRPEVASAELQYRNVGKRHLAVAEWLRRIADLLPDDARTVRQEVGATKLSALRAVARLEA